MEYGTFGEVLKAKNKDDLKEDVTIRTFRQSHKRMDELDMSEIEQLSLLEHDNVAKIHDTVWHISNSGGVELYLVYQYCDRGDLHVFLQDKGRLNEAEIRDFIRQMTQGMGLLRKIGIVHRDLKPSNILVQTKPNNEGFVYKIADLGLTKLFFDQQHGIAFNDQVFVAPEILKSVSLPCSPANSSANLQRYFQSALTSYAIGDKKMDIWSLGLLVLTCLKGGEIPFNGADIGQYSCDKEIDAKGQIPKGTAEDLVGLLLNMVKLEAAERIDFEALIKHPFLKPLIWFARPHVHKIPCSSLVTSLACDETHVFCGLESGLIEVFERFNAFDRVKRLDSHRKTVSALAVNKEIIISGSQDTTIAVWSRGGEYERLQLLYHHRNTVIGIEIIDKSAYSACLDGTHKAFSIDYKKLYARKNGFGGRRLSIQEHSNAEFREEIEFADSKTGKSYPAHWRDHDHMHTVAGIIVMLIYVAEDCEFRPFHILSSRAFNSLQPQLVIRRRDDGNEHFVRKITFSSHVRQIRQIDRRTNRNKNNNNNNDEDENENNDEHMLVLLHWSGEMTLFSADEILSPLGNAELIKRKLLSAEVEERKRPTWFCHAPKDGLAAYNRDTVTVFEYKL